MFLKACVFNSCTEIWWFKNQSVYILFNVIMIPSQPELWGGSAWSTLYVLLPKKPESLWNEKRLYRYVSYER